MTNKLISEIQSLRGFSVLIVVLFHFFPTIMPRGYLGVDIFFVISGYLMAKIIDQKISINRFSVIEFYKSRFKRIIPNLIFVIFIIYLISSELFLPIDFKNLQESIKFTYFLIPNIYYWLNGGYFGLIDELKPFLHLWSIGVELQFYIFLPIIYFLFIQFFSYHKIIFIILIIFISSISLNFYINLIDGYNFSFFIIFTRLWEFMTGSLIFHYKKKIKNNYLLILSFIVLSFVLINGFSNYLLNQMCVTFFASSILIFNFEKSIFKKINLKILIFLGLMSYSLYLWHWPLISLFRYYSIEEPDFKIKLILIFISFIFSYFSFIFIENKFRFKFNFRQNIIAFLSITFIILLFGNIKKNNFFYDNEIAIKISSSVGTNFRCSLKDYILYGHSRACLINQLKPNTENLKEKKLIALYGNSHAQMYGYAFEKILQINDLEGIIIPLNNCLPTPDLNVSSECLFKSKNNFNELIKDNNINIVIIGLNYDHKKLINDDGVIFKSEINKVLTTSIKRMIKNLTNNNKKIILIGPIAEPGYNFPLDYSRNIFFKKKLGLSNYSLLKDFELKNKFILKSFENEKKIQIFFPHLIQCQYFKCNYMLDNNSIFADNNHLSKFGSMMMINELNRMIKKFN